MRRGKKKKKSRNEGGKNKNTESNIMLQMLIARFWGGTKERHTNSINSLSHTMLSFSSLSSCVQVEDGGVRECS